MPQLIDLSVFVETNAGEPLSVKVQYIGHKEGADKFGHNLIWKKRGSFVDNIKNSIQYLTGKRRINRTSFPDNEFISLENIQLSSHTGTHMDSPSHFGSLCENKKPKTIDEIPLDWCYGDGVVLDFRYKKGGEFITKDNIIGALNKINYQIKKMILYLS